MNNNYTPSDMIAMSNAGDGFGGNGNGGWFWLFFLWLIVGSRGFGYGYGPDGQGAGSVGGNQLYPWMELNNAVNGGFNGVQQALCNGFAGVNGALTAGFAGVESGANARAIASMQQSFGMQTAINQGFNGIASQFADCCCENRLGLANLNSTILAENCADRAAVDSAARDLATGMNAGFQRIIDQMCQDKIDEKNYTIAQLRSELMYARGQASQDVQTAAIQAGQRGLANEIEQYVLPTPRPAYIVANPNCCQPNFGCGCAA